MHHETTLQLWYEKEGKEIHLIPPASARNCKQTLQLISNENKQRDILGNLCAIGSCRSVYMSRIIGQDHAPVASDIDWDKHELWLDCAVAIQRPVLTEGENVQLSRPAVPGSVFLVTRTRSTPLEAQNQSVTVPASNDGDAFLRFRPRLKVIVRKTNIELVEWNIRHSWSLEVEEV